MRKLLVVVVSGALLAGCGGDSPEVKYRKGVNKAQEKFGSMIVSNPDDSAQAAALRGFADELAKLDPPDKVENAARALITEARHAAAETEAGRSVKLDQQRMKATIDTINGSL